MTFSSVKAKSVRGGVITMASQGVGVAINFTSTVVLARLLVPEDYGLIAMVLAFTAFAGLFRDLGLSSAAIQSQKLTPAQQSNLFWVNVLLGLMITLLVALCSPVISWFYGDQRLKEIGRAMSVTFLISSLGTQHGVDMTRNMQFGRLAAASIVSGILGLTVAIVLALNGWGHWALVLNSLVSASARTALCIALSSFRAGLPQRNVGTFSMLRFGAHVTVFELCNYFSRNLDNLLIGKISGPVALGLYSRAYQLLMFPIQNVRAPLQAVAYPALSKLRAHPNKYREYYRRLTGCLALITMPLVGFLFVASDLLVEILLGKKWLNVVPLFKILSVVAFLQPVASLRGMVMLSLGFSRRYMIQGAVGAAITSLGFVIGSSWGPAGVAVAYAIVFYTMLVPMTYWSFLECPVSVRDLYEVCCGPLFATVAGCLVASACRLYITDFGLISQALITFLFFGTAFFIIVYWIDGSRELIRRLLHNMNQAVSVGIVRLSGIVR